MTTYKFILDWEKFLTFGEEFDGLEQYLMIDQKCSYFDPDEQIWQDSKLTISINHALNNFNQSQEK